MQLKYFNNNLLFVKMQTRSLTRYAARALYTVDINFDEASEAWKTNKQSIGNGMYKYICCQKTKNGKNCNCKCLPGSNYCKRHNKSDN